MNKKRIIICLLISLLAAMAFAACSKNEEPETPTTEEVVEETVVEETQVSEEAEESVEFSYPKPENNPLGLDVYDAAGRELVAGKTFKSVANGEETITFNEDGTVTFKYYDNFGDKWVTYTDIRYAVKDGVVYEVYPTVNDIFAAQGFRLEDDKLYYVYNSGEELTPEGPCYILE